MFQEFPYSDMHQLNLDWIIKIAKDFLDQYTTIQNTITEGLEGLDAKYTELQGLLDAWYATHSEDIANQLAAAIRDLNAWYTTHENYLNETLANNISAFNAAAEQKARDTIETIPADYTAVANGVLNLNDMAVANDLSSTKFKLNKMFAEELLNISWNPSNNSNSAVTVYPCILFFPGYENRYDNLNDTIATKIRLNAATTGTLTIGLIPKSRIVIGNPFDPNDVIVKDVLTITDTGTQIIELNNPFTITKDVAVAIGLPTDSVTFKYGAEGIVTGFTYRLEGAETFYSNSQSLGIDIFGLKPVNQLSHDLSNVKNNLNYVEKTIVRGCGEGNSTPSVLSACPFILSDFNNVLYDYANKLITAVRLYVYQPGTISLGYVPYSAIEQGDIIYYAHYTITNVMKPTISGYQTIKLDNPFYVPDNCALFIQWPLDTGLFLFGSTDNTYDKGFTFVNEGQRDYRRNYNSLGVDIICSVTPYESLKGKKISILGDSISSYNGYNPSGYDYWYPNGNVNNANKTWWLEVINDLGLVMVKNASWSGSTVTGDSTSTVNAFAGCSTARINDLKDGATVPDIIVCYIGINDFGLYARPVGTYDGTTEIPAEGTLTNFSDAYALMLKKVMTAYPNATVYCCTLMEASNGAYDPDNPSAFPTKNSAGTALAEYNDCIRTLAQAIGAKLIDLHNCGITHWNTGSNTIDGIHPNKAGHLKIKEMVINKLLDDLK